MITILKGTIYYIISKKIIYIPLLINDSNTYTVATEAFFTSKSFYKLLLKLAFKKYKKFYIGPNKETSGRMILRYSNDLVVGRATYKNSLYVV